MAGPLAIAHTEASLGWGGQEIRTLTEAAGFIARGHRVDIVNGHSSTDTWLDALACRWLRVRDRPRPVLIRTRHVSIPVPHNRATRWLYQRATTRIVTTGEMLRAQLVRDNGIDPARIDSVPTGIDPAAFAPR